MYFIAFKCDFNIILKGSLLGQPCIRDVKSAESTNLTPNESIKGNFFDFLCSSIITAKVRYAIAVSGFIRLSCVVISQSALY